MTKRKRRRSEKKAAKMAVEEQGDLLSEVPGLRPVPEGDGEEATAEVETASAGDAPADSDEAADAPAASATTASTEGDSALEEADDTAAVEALVEAAEGLGEDEAEVAEDPREDAEVAEDAQEDAEVAEDLREDLDLAEEDRAAAPTPELPFDVGDEVDHESPQDAESSPEDAETTAEETPSDSAADASDEPPAVVWEFPSRRSITFEMVADDIPAGEPPKPPPAGDRLARAKERVQQGRVEEAVELYRSILDENPANLKARNNLGALYEALGQHELALEQFEAAVRVEPENVEVLNNLGSTLAVLGRYEEGEAALRRALRLSPDAVELRASLGILYFRRGIYAQAEAELRWVCEQDREHGNAFFYRGEALNRLGRVDEAMEALEQATVLQPRNAKAFYTLGLLYDRKHLREEAALMYRRSRELQKG